MKHINTVFHPLLKYIPRYRFDRAEECHGGDRRERILNCWMQFVALIYTQLAQRVSLEEGKKLIFINNDFEHAAQAIADQYKMRWQIKLFFKWDNQNLKIKRFLSTSKNGVLIQMPVAIIAYLLIRLVQQSFPNSLSMQQWARLICANIFARKQLEPLAAQPLTPQILYQPNSLILALLNRTIVGLTTEGAVPLLTDRGYDKDAYI
jgi:hypothetical protein